MTFCSMLILTACRTESPEISLAGKWTFSLDPKDVGMKQNWFNSELKDTINLPGSLQEQGKGYALA